MEERKKHPNWGGARPGSGRPKGSRDRVSIANLLDALDAKSGQSYEEILIEDFLNARAGGDTALVQKYHHLISNKVMNSLAAVEVTDPTGQVEARQAAFIAALEQVVARSENKDNEQ